VPDVPGLRPERVRMKRRQTGKTAGTNAPDAPPEKWSGKSV